MSVTMRVIQRYRITAEREFLELEERFAALERRRPELPQGRRMKPLAAAEPNNTLVWQGEFPSLEAARKALTTFEGDPEHEALFKLQGPLFESVHVEFYDNL